MKKQPFKYDVSLPTPYQMNQFRHEKHNVELYTYGDCLEDLFNNVGFVAVDFDGNDLCDPQYYPRIACEADKAAITRWYMQQEEK